MRKKRLKSAKKYVIKHRRKTVHAVRRVHKHPAFFVPLMTFGALLTLGVAALLVMNRGSNPIPELVATDSKIVIVTDDGEEQTVPTRAEDVGELLERLEITLNEGDVVEPSTETEIVSDNFRVNVYRALPVTIFDGEKEIRALSAAATPRSIARQAGIEAYPEDELTLDPVEDFVTQGVIGQRLVVKRSTPINLNLYGTQLEMRTQAKTVREFLEEKDIKLAAGETVQPSLDAPIDTNNPVFVNKPGIKVETRTEEVAFDTRYVEDPNLTFGVTALRQHGSPGRRVVTYQVNIRTGERTPFHQITVRKPIDQVMARGTYINIPSNKQSVMAAAGISRGDFVYVDYIISRESGWNAAASNSSSGAYGLCQALPGSKMATAGSDWRTNAVTQLRWCHGYATGRYGSWAAAYNFWTANHWW